MPGPTQYGHLGRSDDGGYFDSFQRGTYYMYQRVFSSPEEAAIATYEWENGPLHPDGETQLAQDWSERGFMGRERDTWWQRSWPWAAAGIIGLGVLGWVFRPYADAANRRRRNAR